MQHIDYLKTLIEDNVKELNDISKDFITDYKSQEIDYLSDKFSAEADSACPIYYSDIDETYTVEMIDNYLASMGSVTISDFDDWNSIKQKAIYFDYLDKLNDDFIIIKAVLYAYLMLDNLELIEKIEDDDIIQEFLISLANNGKDSISLDELKAEIKEYTSMEDDE